MDIKFYQEYGEKIILEVNSYELSLILCNNVYDDRYERQKATKKIVGESIELNELKEMRRKVRLIEELNARLIEDNKKVGELLEKIKWGIE